MPRPHAMLRGAMVAADIDEQYLARKLLRGKTYVSERMMGRKPWQMDEVYTIMDLLRLPHDKLAVYFPPQKGA